MRERVGIIGAGFSGLLCAYLLEQTLGDNVDIVLFEKSDRAGGRVQTTDLSQNYPSYEAGAAEFYDIAGNSQLLNLVHHLGLGTRLLSGTPYFVVNERVVRNDLDLKNLVGRRGMDRLRRFWEQGTALRPPCDYARAGQMHDNEHPWIRLTFDEVLMEIDDPFCQWFTEMQCHSDLATEPSLTSGLFGMDNLLIDHPGYCSMYTLQGGNEGLVKALAERIGSPVLLNTPVYAIDAREDQGLHLKFGFNGEDRDEIAIDSLIVTLPPPAIRTIRWSGLRLRRAVNGHVRHHDHSTTYLRVTLFFRKRFWRRVFPEDYFVSDAFGGVTVYDQSPDDGSAGMGIQSWLLAGINARNLLPSSDKEIISTVLAAMPRRFGSLDGMLVAGFVDRWTDASGVSCLPGGVPLRSLDQRHSPDSRWPQLQFVGDYLYDSTLCGALDAVLYAVTRLGERHAVNTGKVVAAATDVFNDAASDSSPSGPDNLSSAFFLDNLSQLGR